MASVLRIVCAVLLVAAGVRLAMPNAHVHGDLLWWLALFASPVLLLVFILTWVLADRAQPEPDARDE